MKVLAASALTALLVAPTAPAYILPIDPDEPRPVQKRQVIRKKQKPQIAHVLPVRKKPPLQP